MRVWGWAAVIVGATISAITSAEQLHAEIRAPQNVRSLPRHLRIDLAWNAEPKASYEIQRATSPDGPFEALRSEFPTLPFHSDVIGEASGTFYYRVRSVVPAAPAQPVLASEWSPVSSAAPIRASGDGFLTEIQESSFRYFYDLGHPVSGLARERFPRDENICAIGATGMGLITLAVGSERGFAPRADVAARVTKILRFLDGTAERFHGAFPHWLHGETGKVIPFSRFDDGADLVETAFLAQGLIFAREFFSGSGDEETAIRALADKLWRAIEWKKFVRGATGERSLMWHWSPRHGWKMNLRIVGFNECQIAYVLALASPTHAIEPAVYTEGWTGPEYATAREKFGIPLELGSGSGPPLFFAHYSYLGFDPRSVAFNGRSYFDHFRDLCRVQVLYSASRQTDFAGYGSMWGLTSSYDIRGYACHSCGDEDNGTISPTAALSSMPYVPGESASCLVRMYESHGKRLWGPFGFYDAFNFSKDWVAKGFLGIDVGPIAPMVENHRTGLCWRVFMKAPEIAPVVGQLRDLKAAPATVR